MKVTQWVVCVEKHDTGEIVEAVSWTADEQDMRNYAAQLVERGRKAWVTERTIEVDDRPKRKPPALYDRDLYAPFNMQPAIMWRVPLWAWGSLALNGILLTWELVK